MDRLNEAPKHPAMVENHVSKVEKLNREKVCQKKLIVKKSLEQLFNAREDKLIAQDGLIYE